MIIFRVNTIRKVLFVKMSANEHFVKLFVQHSEFNLLENGALEELSRSF